MSYRNLVLVGLAAAGCRVALAGGDLPPLIPREVLFGNPDKTNPRISPNGGLLAYLAPDEGVLNVWVRGLAERDERPLTKDRHRGVKSFLWAPGGERILYVQDKDGDENWHVFSVDVRTADVRDLTPFPGVQARIVAVEETKPKDILVALNRRDPQQHDVFRLNLETGELKLEVENKGGYLAWTADRDLRVRAALRLTGTGTTELAVRDPANGSWRTLTSWSADDVLTSGPVGVAPDGRGLYIISSTNGNTGELRVIDLRSGEEKTLASDCNADVAAVLVHPIQHTIQAVGFNKERLHWKVLDPTIRKDFKVIDRFRRGDFTVINRDDADETWLVEYTCDDGPVYYYAYNRGRKQAELLFSNRKALESLTLAKMEPISFIARDGLFIHGYLTTPPGLPVRNLPMVVLVHGGPWSRDTWGYNPTVQWLANRGYAVLQVNFRGSEGYGKQFVNAANREWGGAIQDDLIDGVNWAVSRGIADKDRIALFGSSFGGYATLAGLAFTPETFSCGVDISGPSNLASFVQNLPPYMKSIEPLLWDRIGHPEKDAAFLRARSPFHSVDRITKPLLIGQGANDPRVTKQETMQLVEALRKAGKSVEYVEYPDEGHGFAKPENRLDFYNRAERFLAEHLGGRFGD